MKDGIDFHLYINTAPCGDARIFSPYEQSIDKHPNRKSRGQLRKKIESGEGTIPAKTSSIQTWDGVIQVYKCLQNIACRNNPKLMLLGREVANNVLF